MAKTAAIIGKFVPFDPTGTYLRPVTKESPPGPSVIRLADLGLAPGDYIALRGTGQWRPGANLPPVQRMSGVFRKSKSSFLAPAAAGQEKPFENWAAPNQTAPNLATDFDIPYGAETVVRVPKGAVEIALNSGDWKFMDNVALPDCGVRVTLPNKKASIPRVVTLEQSAAVLSAAIEDVPDPQELRRVLPPFAESALPPKATSFAKSPFAKKGDDSYPQWRGWYDTLDGQGEWLPHWSGYGAVRRTKTHWGWDIFCPRGAKLIAPVGPAKFEWIPDVTGYGNVASFFFSYKKKLYRLFYGHCDEALVPAGATVSVGQQVATAGCSGNAKDERCGLQLLGGGRTDHVHVGLVPGDQVIADKYVDTPSTLLNWTIRTP